MSDATAPVCPNCGGDVPPKSATGPQATYCSTKCRTRACYVRRKAAGTILRPAPIVKRERRCAQCDATFLAPRRDSRLCGRKCERAWLAANETRRCSVEGCRRTLRAKGLCNPCYRKARRQQGISESSPWTDARRDAYHRRRALKKGTATGESVNLADIKVRDKGRCHLCSRRVPDKPWPHPLSPSLDHVIPLSRGGAHDPANVRLAHLRCNTAKGNREVGEQLLLIG